MSWDRADRPSVAEIPQERVDRIIGAVLARLDETPQPAMTRPDRIGRLRVWLTGLIPAPRFAMPMAAAAALGVMVSQHLQAAETALQFSDLLSYTSITTLGF